MRLICGLYRLDLDAVAGDTLVAMAKAMVAPELTPAIHVSTAGAIGLAVLDFASPCRKTTFSDRADMMLAADRRLDDADALRNALGCPEDDEDRLVAAALEHWGVAAPDHILGDFAFAHWAPGCNRLLCARDPFGVRPLHYAWREGEWFAFASFPSGLHATGLIPRMFDRAALARYLLQRPRPGESLFTGIARLPAAHFLEVSPSGLSVRRYWAPKMADPKSRLAPEAAAAEMRARLNEAVRCRLPRSGTAGAHLSGGLDSSAITILAARELHKRGEQLRAWSFLDAQRHDLALDDETHFVEAVLDQEPGIAWTAVRLPCDDIDPGPYHADLPMPLGPQDPDCAVCVDAAAADVGIILSGWGGDEATTFNGRGVLAEHLVRGRWRMLARELLAIRRERGTPVATTIRTEILAYLAPAPVHAMWSRKRAGGLADRLTDSLSADLAALLRADRGSLLSLTADARENRVRLIGAPHIAQRCENWAALGARHGLAFAFPMLDRRLVEFALSLPSEAFLRGGWKRRVFRDAMRNVLPEAIRQRHDKATPFPSMPLIFAQQREKLIERVDALAQDATARSVFDLSRLRAQVAALPNADAMKAGMKGNATPAADTPALRHPLRMAAFLAQRASHS